MKPLPLLLLLIGCTGKTGDSGRGLDGSDGTDGETGDPEGPDFSALSAAIEADLAQANATGAQVAVWLDGRTWFVGGFGSADPEGDVAVDEDTFFMIGSDTKKLAALSLLLHVQSGDLDLDETVAERLPALDMALATDFPQASVHDLLSHQGGIVDGAEYGGSTTDAALATYAYGFFADNYYPLAPPHRFWNYSNPNFSIAGLIDEELAGEPWADRMQGALFAPLGMARTVARKEAVDGNRATGVGLSSQRDTSIGPVSFADTWESAFTRPAGLVWSTASDQARIIGLLIDGQPDLIDNALQQTVFTAQAPMYPDLPGDYGYGLMMAEDWVTTEGSYPVRSWSHGGNTLTHTSTFSMLPDQRVGISILSNGYGDDFHRSVEAAFTSLVTLPPIEAPPTYAVDPDGLDALEGLYTDAFNAGDIHVSRVGDGLVVSMPLLDDLGIPYQPELIPITTRVWYLQAQGTYLDFAFIDGPDGETYFRNRSVVAIRQPPGSARRSGPGPLPSKEVVEQVLREAGRPSPRGPLPPPGR